MGKERAENLHRELSEERDGGRNEEQEQRSEQKVSEDK